MDERANLNLLKRLEVVERPSSTFNSQIVEAAKRDHFVIPVSRPVSHCRFIIHPTRMGQKFSLDLIACDGAPSPAASVIHPIGEEHHQESCCTDTREHSSQQTEHQMLETAVQTKTKSMEMDNKESKDPHIRAEQSLFRRAFRFLITLFIILAVFYIIMIGIQTGYVNVEATARSWDLWRRPPGKFNPPT